MNRILALAALTLCACAPLKAQTAKAPKPKTATTAKKTTTAGGTAHLRILHALPGAPAVDVYARGDEKIKTALTYKGLTEYTDVKSGKMALKVTATGKSDALIEDSITLTKDKWYTLAAYGDLKTPMLMLVNESTGKEMPDKARVRVVHLVSGADTVSVTKPSTRAADGSANFLPKPLEYGKSASKTLAPTTETIQLRDAEGKLLKEMPDVKLEEGMRYTAFAIGKADGTGDMALDLVIKPAAQ